VDVGWEDQRLHELVGWKGNGIGCEKGGAQHLYRLQHTFQVCVIGKENNQTFAKRKQSGNDEG
jgi:hypothetical protein